MRKSHLSLTKPFSLRESTNFSGSSNINNKEGDKTKLQDEMEIESNNDNNNGEDNDNNNEKDYELGDDDSIDSNNVLVVIGLISSIMFLRTESAKLT
ncbi:10430_t:CDS:2 [Funneliformis geosporum]|nr:10430_t:CDS:2 [Funneliformis geosporum]